MAGAAIAPIARMGHQVLAISSGALGTLIWAGVIAIVMICLLVVGVVGFSARDKTKT
jgi:hypothetical protein